MEVNEQNNSGVHGQRTHTMHPKQQTPKKPRTITVPPPQTAAEIAQRAIQMGYMR
jgi:hypothetical protein